MIPRSRPASASPSPEIERPEGLPPVEHSAIDYDFAFTSGALLPVSLIDSDGSVTEQDDRYVVSLPDGEILTILKIGLAYVRQRSRTFTTEPALFTPGQESRHG